jgi:transposase
MGGTLPSTWWLLQHGRWVVDKLRLPALLRLKILCNQLQHTRQHLAHLEREIDSLLEQDPRTKGLQGVREFGHKTSAVLRAELGDVERFSRCDQAIA